MLLTISFIGLCIAIVCYDLLFRRVPNWLLLTAFTVHVGWLLIVGHGLGGITIWQSLLGGAIGFGLFIPLYVLRAMGAGDVKCFALLGMIMGPHYLIPLWIVGSILAGVHAVAWYFSTTPIAMTSALWNRLQTSVTNSSLYQTMIRRRSGRRGIPYAAYLAVAAIAVAEAS